MTSDDDLLQAIHANTREALHYARMRFLGTWAVVALLALFTGVAVILATETAKTNLKQTDDIARVSSTNAEAAKTQSDQIVLYLQGKQGIPGVPGANGQDGAPGQPGSVPSDLPPGPKGPKGDTGAAGATGAVGAAGTVGATGAIGAVGPPGALGPAGSTGLEGAVGSTGPAGEKGADGATGSAGPKGDKGDKGDTGAAGPKGETGATGPAGPQGPAGPNQLIGVSTVSAQSPNDVNGKDVTATCPADTQVISGGYHWTPATPGIGVIADEPAGANGWHVEAIRDTFPANSPWQLTVFAVCNVVPPTPK